jgi:hypothetical protein
MRKSRSTTLLCVVGVVLIALAAIIRVLLVPVLVKLPGSTDTTMKYAGTVRGLDPATFKLGGAAPITAERRFKVVRTDGDVAVLATTTTLHTPAGDLVDPHTFAIDRTDYAQADAPAGVTVDDQQGGLTLSRPMHPTKGTFTVYDAVTDAAHPVEFSRSSVVAGRDVYEFAGQSTALVKSPSVLAQLHAGVAGLAGTGDGTTVPKAVLQGVAATLDGPAAKQFTGLLVTLPDQVPLAYTSTSKLEVAVDRELGTPLRTAQTQSLAVNVDTGAQLVPLATLTETDLTQTPASSKATADLVRTAATKLTAITTWIPVGLALLGAVLLLTAIRRKANAPVMVSRLDSAAAPEPTRRR